MDFDNKTADRYCNNVISWHDEMADYIRSNDPFNHLVTTSIGSSDPDKYLYKNAFRSLDFVQEHKYFAIQKAKSKEQSSYQLYQISVTTDALYPNKPLYIGEFGFGKHLVLTVRLALSLCHIGHTHIHQIDGIVHIWTMLALGITCLELAEGLDGKREILEFLVDDDTFVVEPFLDEFVGSLFLVVGERNLCQIILRLVRIVGILVFCGGFFSGMRTCSGSSAIACLYSSSVMCI